jgi:hypothetical protein
MAVLAQPSPNPEKILNTNDVQKKKESSLIYISIPNPAVQTSIMRTPPSKMFFRPNLERN